MEIDKEKSEEKKALYTINTNYTAFTLYLPSHEARKAFINYLMERDETKRAIAMIHEPNTSTLLNLHSKAYPIDSSTVYPMVIIPIDENHKQNLDQTNPEFGAWIPPKGYFIRAMYEFSVENPEYNLSNLNSSSTEHESIFRLNDEILAMIPVDESQYEQIGFTKI